MTENGVTMRKTKKQDQRTNMKKYIASKASVEENAKHNEKPLVKYSVLYFEVS